MKKILLATRPLVPPWDEASKNFAYFLAKSMESHHVSILTTPTWLPDLPANVTQIPCYTKNELDFSEKLRLLSALRGLRNKFDITHYLFTPTRKNTSLINFFSRPTHGKTIQTIATLREDLYGAKQWRQLLFADRIIVYSDHSKHILERVGFDNVTRIYPGIDLSLYQPQPKDAEALAFFNLTPDDFIVMYPGEYVRLGATDMLAEWLIEYYHTHPDSALKFVFACRVKHEDDRLKKVEITERFAAAGILDRIRFTDTYADMPKLYNLADIMAFPVGDMRGKFDVPLVIIEAYACGKPVILSDLPIFQEFSGSDVCVTIPRGSKTALTETITFLQEHPETRTSLGHQARAFVKRSFDLADTVKQYETIYESL
ncbi:MAG: glycosyltransferase family 4 protein [Candidatus Moranbacteria bacterium]|nr:glycosyltransferase family 4 protein [Candidatus Moranbacteria bacterium]MBP6034364.1 glycosyltransferase family 4 protein [Candidatus Moranbacteria bacterium]MBP7696084.1 glycosyltransferase family 4 protein [Candidatus Moranbacteria bacterium]